MMTSCGNPSIRFIALPKRLERRFMAGLGRQPSAARLWLPQNDPKANFVPARQTAGKPAYKRLAH